MRQVSCYVHHHFNMMSVMIGLTCFQLDLDQSNDDGDFYNVSHTAHQTICLSNHQSTIVLWLS